MKGNATAAEKRWMDRVAGLGCMICKNPAQVHHLQCFKPRNNCGVIPLCPEHHMGVFSIHKTKAEFLRVYGDEINLLAETIRRLA